MKNFFGILITLILLLTACTAASISDTASYKNITVEDLESMLENKDIVLMNTHIPHEGDIPNTDLFIPFDQIEMSISQLPSDKDAQIVVYCRSGNMSVTASETLIDLGYTNVYNLSGGYNAWVQAGLPFGK